MLVADLCCLLSCVVFVEECVNVQHGIVCIVTLEIYI